MGLEVRPQTKTKKRTVALAVGASVLLVLFGAGFAFANSVGAARVADNARDLHWANATLGTSSLARAALAQATTFIGLKDEGLVSRDEVAFTMDQVDSAYDELRQLEQIRDASPSLAPLTHFLGEMGDAMRALREGDADSASALLAADVESAYIDLVDSLQIEQQAIQAAIDDNTAAAATLNGYVVFTLMLAIPAAAVFVYWWIARRQVREYRKTAEMELEAERALSRAKDGFIAGLSHELRTPLTSIYGFAEILTDGRAGEPEQSREVAQIIANEAAEMTRMVDDLLAASRLESTGVEIDLSPTPVQEVVESAITPFQRAGLEVSRQPTNAVVSTDAARLRHVLVNLLSNAARHGGPSVGIEVSLGEDTVDIEVWDDGPGVPEEQVERLFERFIHDGAAPLLSGSVGLGLAIASRLTTLQGGRLSYRRFGGKSYFIVSMPALIEIDTEDSDETGSVAETIRAMSE